MTHEELKKIADDNFMYFGDMVLTILVVSIILLLVIGFVITDYYTIFMAVYIIAPICSLLFIVAIVGYISVHLKNNFIAQTAILEQMQKEK